MTTRTAADALEKLIRLERDLEKKCHDLGYCNMIHVGLREFVEHADTLRAALSPPQAKPAFWARLLNGELDDHSDYCVASDPNDLGDGDEEPGITIVPVYLDPPRIGNGIEPRGCPTPGACSCPAAQPQAGEVEECDNGLGHIEITDGVPDWIKGVATEARRLLRATQSAAPAQEPVAWQDIHDNTCLYYRKPPQGDVRPLYAAPPPDEAGELLREVVDHIFGCGSAVKRIRAYLARNK